MAIEDFNIQIALWKSAEIVSSFYVHNNQNNTTCDYNTKWFSTPFIFKIFSSDLKYMHTSNKIYHNKTQRWETLGDMKALECLSSILLNRLIDLK